MDVLRFGLDPAVRFSLAALLVRSLRRWQVDFDRSTLPAETLDWAAGDLLSLDRLPALVEVDLLYSLRQSPALIAPPAEGDESTEAARPHRDAPAPLGARGASKRAIPTVPPGGKEASLSTGWPDRSAEARRAALPDNGPHPAGLHGLPAPQLTTSQLQALAAGTQLGKVRQEKRAASTSSEGPRQGSGSSIPRPAGFRSRLPGRGELPLPSESGLARVLQTGQSPSGEPQQPAAPLSPGSAARPAALSGGLPGLETGYQKLFLQAVFRQAADIGVSGPEAPAQLLAQAAGLAPFTEPAQPGPRRGSGLKSPAGLQERRSPQLAGGRSRATGYGLPGAAPSQAAPLPGLDLLAGALARLEVEPPGTPARRAFEAALEQTPEFEGPGIQARRAPDAAPEAPPEAGIPPSGPAIQNTFNVTVHMEGGPETGNEELAERLNRLLIEQARRHGIDV